MKTFATHTAALALLAVSTAASAQSGDVVVMRRVLTAPNPTGGAGTPATTPTPTPSPTPTPAPTGEQWTACGSEGMFCDFVGTTKVRYGVEGAYATQTATNGVQCSYQVFGDPASGAPKHCEYDARTASPGNWTYCSDYGQNCVVPSRSVVRMGANGSYLRKTVTGYIACTVDQFGGDPAYGSGKHCDYAPLPDQPQGPPPGSTPGSVTSIEIRAGIVNPCIQLGEVEVYSNGVNVALASNGADVTATAPYSGQASADKAIDGIKPAGYPNVYHSQCSGGDFLRVTFAAPVKVDSVTIYGRTDYADRDVYSYVLYNGFTEVAQGQIDARSGSGTSVPQ